MIANGTGATVWRWDQGEPFGNDVPNNNPSGAGAFDFPLRFPGQYFDKETNLNDNYHREYDSSLGRYIESDPIGLRGGFNGYAYVKNVPLGLIDPLGLRAQVCCRKIPRWWIPAVHCFINEVEDATPSGPCDGGRCPSKTRTVGLHGPAPWGEGRYEHGGDIRTDFTRFDKPEISDCGEWNTSCGVSGCIDQQIRIYPDPSEYYIGGPNSNTFAGTISRACGIPKPDGGWAPGWDMPPAGPYTPRTPNPWGKWPNR